MKPFLPTRTLTAWLCLAVVLFGSGGAHILHVVPGLGHHHDDCCHGHSHAAAHKHSHADHGHAHNHDAACSSKKTDVPIADTTSSDVRTIHDCALCKLIAVVHQGTILVNLPVDFAEFGTSQVYLIPQTHFDSRPLSGPSSRGPPLS